jgi:hypothetical protein
MFCVTAICILFASCKSEEIGSPVITSIRMYNASPKDTLMSVGNPKTDTLWSGGTGKYVAIIGQNLQNALSIKFDGVAATFNTALLAPNSAVVPIPNIIFSKIDTTKLYTLEYVTTTGSTTFSFKLGPSAPTLSAISDVFASPGDSVYVYGSNLVLVKNFSYGGVPITSFKTSLDGSSLGFLMPNPAPTSGQVSVQTKTSTATLNIVATPTITGVSNENANPGDSVYVYGTYLKSIQSFSFGGVAISSYKLSSKGSYIGFVVPSSVTAAPVSVTTSFGTATTVYNVNDPSTGIIANMEWGGSFGWGWWGGSSLSVSDPNSTGGWLTLCADMTGNKTMFMSIKEAALAAGAKGGAIPIGGAQWIPTANLNDPVSNWALKFEVNIPKPWNGSSIAIQTDFASSYTARYEPWKISASATADYSTKGWITVTIPLTEFRAKDAKLGDGRGASITKLTDIVGATGKTSCTVFDNNYGTSAATTGFYGGFDNFRIVKIK